MKIVDRTTFLAMPIGTVYSEYEPCVFGPFLIKGETLFRDDGSPCDWFCQQIHDSLDSASSPMFTDMLDRALETGDSISMNFNIEGRDGCYVEDQLFAVWEQQDVAALIERLQEAMQSSTGGETLR